MSTKTIAVESSVYERLAHAKRAGESFSKVIDRLLTQVGDAHTGRDVLRGLAEIPRLTAEDAEQMLAVVSENREDEDWPVHDLR